MNKDSIKKIEEKAATKEVVVEKTKEVKEEIKAEKKKPIRRSELETRGRLYVDDKYKESGFQYRIVNDNPGRIKLLERLGYEVVRDEDTKIGSGSVKESSQLGSAVALDVGINKSQPAVLMRCPEDEYKARKAEEAKENTSMFENSIKENQYKGQITD